MADAEEQTEEEPKKGSKMPLIIGLVLALIGGGGGFYATWSGMLLASESDSQAAEDTPVPLNDDVTYVSVDPLVISLDKSANSRHLRFRADLEVPTIFQDEVTKVLPRVVDVLNSYLRAVDTGDLEDRAALTRLRAQMLRRVQVVVGRDRVTDLLVMEFVLN
jgi:flagellar FliL protein